MVIRIFYAACGLGLLFFAVFFIQCCRLGPRKSNHLVRKLKTSDAFDSAEATRLFVHWEKEMAEFMARQGRSTALLFLVAASFFAWHLSFTDSEPTIAQVSRRAVVVFERSTSLNYECADQQICKKK